jgi:hypothetical protein
MNDKDLDRHILIHAPINLHQVDSPLEIADDLVDFAQWSEGALIGALMDPVSCVSCVSWMYCVNAAETHETFHQESGMRYQVSSSPILSTNWAFAFPRYPHSYPQDSLERAYFYWARLASWPPAAGDSEAPTCSFVRQPDPHRSNRPLIGQESWENRSLRLAVASGIAWRTSQCSMALPSSLNVQMSTPAMLKVL